VGGRSVGSSTRGPPIRTAVLGEGGGLSPRHAGLPQRPPDVPDRRVRLDLRGDRGGGGQTSVRCRAPGAQHLVKDKTVRLEVKMKRHLGSLLIRSSQGQKRVFPYMNVIRTVRCKSLHHKSVLVPLSCQPLLFEELLCPA